MPKVRRVPDVRQASHLPVLRSSCRRWLLEGLWHGLVCFFAPLLALGRSRRDGTVDGLPTYGVATYTAVILIVNLKVQPASALVSSCQTPFPSSALLLICVYWHSCWIASLPCHPNDSPCNKA